MIGYITHRKVNELE